MAEDKTVAEYALCIVQTLQSSTVKDILKMKKKQFKAQQNRRKGNKGKARQ